MGDFTWHVCWKANGRERVVRVAMADADVDMVVRQITELLKQDGLPTVLLSSTRRHEPKRVLSVDPSWVSGSLLLLILCPWYF